MPEATTSYADVNGGWGYYEFDSYTRQPSGLPTSFTTATALLAMHEAAGRFDIELDRKVVDRALQGVRMQRLPDFSYAYAFPHRIAPRRPINLPAGSLGRSQVCNAALRIFGDTLITDEVIERWAERFLEQEPWFDIARKRPIPHESHFAISGYFYYYGAFYFTRAVQLLPGERRTRLAARLAEVILPRQEKDGSWWDYPLYDYHQAYGTGYALMTPAWCAEQLADKE